MKRTGLRFLIFKLPALAYMAFIFFMSSGPVTSETLNSVPDYVLHALGYSALYLLLFWAVHEGFRVRDGRGGYWLPAFLTVLYGISDEFHQSFIPARQSTVSDVMADAAGALIGMPLVAALAVVTSRIRAYLPLI
jgi:VanZ family protein